MSLSVEIISQFAKATTTKNDKKTKRETTVYGTTVEYDGRMYVKIDGSELLTPVTSTASIAAGERVTVLIKNHTATVTGNISSPSARNTDVKEVNDKVEELGTKISEFEIIAADKVTTKDLDAQKARIDELVSDNVKIKKSVTANEANIKNLEANDVTINNTLTAVNADIDNLETTKLDTEIAEAKYATINNLNSANAKINNLEATYADLETTITNKLEANSASIKKLQTDKLDATTANITYAKIVDLEASNARIADLEGYNAEFINLESEFGDFKVLATDKLSATEANISKLQTEKLSATDIEGKYANIDFSNISEATMALFYANSGLIRNAVIGDGVISGKLVGVTISGDLIEGNTVKADKLVIKGTDGLYYKLNTNGVTTEAEQTDYNSLDGQVIKAKSITATKISVNDLVAFDATIGGFNITEKAIYSGVKQSATNTTRGVYLDSDGQIAFGDSENYVKYYKDQNGNYKLEISAQSVVMASSTSTTSEGDEPETIDLASAISELSENTQSNANDLAQYIASTNIELENLQGQIDGSIMTWFYEYVPTNDNIPASEWTTTDLKNNHLGDLFYDTITGYCYRWQVQNNVYSWNRITDVDVTKALADANNAQLTANSKKRIFVTTPNVPYEVGDLWVQGTTGDIMRCQTAKTSEQSYTLGDWVKASKYTDDTAANNAKSAADAAQADVNAVKTRVSSAETKITQNTEQIALRATKTEITETLGGYYTKSQADAAIKVSADSISQNVSKTYATKTALDTTNSNVETAQNTATQAKSSIDNLKLGGRNLAVGTSEEWVEVNVGPWSGQLRHTVNGTRNYTHTYEDYGIKVGECLTFSAIMSAVNKPITIRVDLNGPNGTSGKYGNYIQAGETGKSTVTVYATDNYTEFNVYIGSDGSVSDVITQKYKCFKVEKGNRSTDWTPAPEDVDAEILAVQEAANNAQSDVDAVKLRVTNAETAINQNSESIALRATKTEVSTAKNEAISTAANDATTKANNALSSANTNTSNKLKSYSTTSEMNAAIQLKADSITSSVSSTYATKSALDTTNNNVTAAQNTANEAKNSINGLEIGGRNYILNSDKWVLNGGTATGITQTVENGVKKIVCTASNGNWNSFVRDNVIEDNFKTGDQFTFAVEIKSEDSTKLPSIYFKSGLGYFGMKGTISSEYSWIYYTGTWNDTNTISFHLGWSGIVGTYYLRRIMFVKGNKLVDWSAAPEDITKRVTEAETKINQNADAISLRATKTEVSTAKSEAISTAASDATTKANNAKNSAISTAATDASAKANNALSSAKSYTDAQIQITSDSITSSVNSVKTTADSANSYVNNAKNNHGYQYKKTITINGDASTYYPVLILGGDQNVMREIMIKRSYSDTAPTDWNGHPTAKGISLLLKIKCNFGGWGGANYSWVIHDLEECYGHVFAGAQTVMSYMGFVVFLRGGGETGATYTLYSDQILDREYMNGTSVRVCYNQERIGWSGGTSDSPTYSWNAPAPRTYTGEVEKEILSKKYIEVANTANEVAADAQESASNNADRINKAESVIQQLADSISMLVVDESGESLMVQNGDQWTFNMGTYNESLSSVSNELNDLVNDIGDTQNTVDILRQAVDDLGILTDYVKITTYNDQPCIELGEIENDFKLRITNTEIQFVEGTSIPAYLSNEKLYIEQAEITGELQQGGFVWKKRSNGNLGLMWKGES